MERISKMWRSGLALVLAICMVIGVIPATAFAAEEEINYVSIGDSMANGYGLKGYKQGDHQAAADGYVWASDDMYGAGAYPELFEKYLEDCGFEVNHTKLATSGMIATDLLYVLGGIDERPDDGWTGFENYLGIYWEHFDANADRIKATFCDAVADADLITLGLGNGSFGAYMMDVMMKLVGLNPQPIPGDLNLEKALALVEGDENFKKTVKALYADLYSELMAAADEMALPFSVETLCNVMVYAGASHMTAMKGSLERIAALNDKENLEVVLIGMTNTMEGVRFVDDNGEAFDFGALMEIFYKSMNAYLAAMPTAMQENGKLEGITFYYTDALHSELVSDIFLDLYADGTWAPANDKGMDMDVLRMRTIRAIVDYVFVNIVGQATADQMKGENGFVNQITQTNNIPLDVNDQGIVGAYIMTSAYLGIEKAVADNMDTKDIPLASLAGMTTLMTDIGNVMDITAMTNAFVGAYTDVCAEAYASALTAALQNGADQATADAAGNAAVVAAADDAKEAAMAAVIDMVYDILNSGNFAGICTLFGLAMVGDGIVSHPSAAGHYAVYDAIVEKYEAKHTAKDETVKNVKYVLGELKGFLESYGSDVAEDVLALWEKEGYVEQVETCIAQLTEILEAREANYTDVVLPALNNTIDALEGQKEALTAELTVLKAQLEAKKAELEKVLAEQNIPGVSAPDLSIDVELGNNQPTTVPGNDCPGAGNTADELEAAVADLEHAIAVIEALIADITADINDMVALANDIIDAIASLEKTLTDIAAAAQALKDAVDAVAEVLTDDSAKAATETFINAFNTAREAALTAADALTLLVETVNADAAAIESAIDVLVNGVEVLFNKFVEDEDAYKQILLDNLTDEEKALGAVALGIVVEALKENEDAINAAIEAKKAELKAQLETELKALEEKYRPEIEAKLKDLEDKKAELEAKKAELEPQLKAEFEAKYAELTAKAEAEIAALEAAAAEKLAALEAELAAKQAELAALAEDAAEEVRAGIQAQIDRITGDIATINADLLCATEHVDAALKAAYDALVAEVTALYNQAVAELENAYNQAIAELENAYNNLVAEYEAAVKALKDAYNAAVKELEDAVGATIEEIKEQVRATIEEIKQSLIDLGVETVEDLVEAVTNLVKDILHRATHADLALGGTSTYVALGDGSAEAEGYVELLAERLQAQYGIQGYTNYAAAGNTVASVKANLGSYADLADADLITVGFSNVTMLSNAIANALEDAPAAYDWTKLVGKELVPYVEEALAEVYAEIAAIGLDAEMTEMLNIAVEGIAYGALEYAIELPQLIAAIREVNADAVIVILGQYNPMDGAVLKFGDVSVDVSEYIGYFVNGVTAHGIAYCVLTGEAIFVEAPAVATANTDNELTIADLLKMMRNDFASMYPSTTGDTYITNQILEALNISKIPVVLWGDADSNGAITLRDAILILQAANGKDAAIDSNASDVTADGQVNLQDAIYVLKRVNGHADLFPAER